VYYVLDACALIAYLASEPGAEVVEALLLDPASDCFVHAVNICEMHYHLIRTDGEEAANDAVAAVTAVGVVTVETLGQPVWRDAARLKAAHRISLADAIGLALTRALQATFVTSDHHELDALAAAGICPIR
jgi:uncharacterized protein